MKLKFMTILSAENSKDALSILNSFEKLPDLILTHAMMPEMNGYELTRHKREDMSYNEIPVILLTSKTDDSMKSGGFEYDETDYSVKPFNASEFVARIEAQVELKMLREKVMRFNEELYRELRISKGKSATLKIETSISGDSEEKILRVIEFIKKNFTSDISREGMAAAVGISADYLSRVFNKVTGKRIDEYINELRVVEAQVQLRESERTVTSIAFDVGFDNIRTFNKSFATFTGMTPSKWRALRQTQ